MFTDLTICKTVYLEDHGQDLLQWELNVDGVVIDCIPGHSWAWKGCRVVNHEHLKAGDQLLFVPPEAQSASDMRVLRCRADRVVYAEEQKSLFEVRRA